MQIPNELTAMGFREILPCSTETLDVVDYEWLASIRLNRHANLAVMKSRGIVFVQIDSDTVANIAEHCELAALLPMISVLIVAGGMTPAEYRSPAALTA